MDCGFTLSLALALFHEGHAPPDVPIGPYAYDEAIVVRAEMIGGSGTYDPGVSAGWLVFESGRGDLPIMGEFPDDGRTSYSARPTRTPWGEGALLTREEREHEGWVVRAESADISSVGSVLDHRVAAGPDGFWVVWQEGIGSSYDVMVRYVDGRSSHLPRPYRLRSNPGANDDGFERERSASTPVADTPDGEWHPDVAVGPDGRVLVVWDAYDGASFDVRGRIRSADGWREPFVIADGPRFQARPTCVALPDGRFFVAWEEGAEGWGREYRSVDTLWNNVTDAYGPVHSFRLTRCGFIETDGTWREVPYPMPSLELAEARVDARDGAETVGVFYERPEVAVDGVGRPWVVVRHMFAPQVARPEACLHHVEEGWRLVARCLTADGWSDATAFDIPQRDGNQRLSVAGTELGIVAAWGTGRSDRRDDPLPRGVARGAAGLAEGSPPALAPGGAPLRPVFTWRNVPGRRRPTVALDDGPEMVLVYGDLHRHTDLSLCFPFYDGSLDDAYRYAIEVARLDFLAITDHTRDLDHGDAQGLLWHRAKKEVTRHELPGTFIPFFAFERSHGDTDHNVITLDPEVIEDFPPPLPEYWSRLGRDTFTIPHNPFIGDVWEHHDDVKRPLLEVYQGFRDQESEAPAEVGLSKGYHLGLIASSDHLSTSASYACVWTTAVDRESIFRAMQSRRTFGATTRATLVFRSGRHWMGERFTTDAPPEFEVRYEGTAPVAAVTWIVDGAPHRAAGPPMIDDIPRWVFTPGDLGPGEHRVRVRIEQRDGHRAWSSPMWYTAR